MYNLNQVRYHQVSYFPSVFERGDCLAEIKQEICGILLSFYCSWHAKTKNLPSRWRKENKTKTKPTKNHVSVFLQNKTYSEKNPGIRAILFWDDPNCAITESSIHSDQSYGDFLSHVSCSFPPSPTQHFSLPDPTLCPPATCCQGKGISPT